jgi:hypothetical protein
MSRRTRLEKAPFDQWGGLMEYVGTVEPHEWRENKPFSALLAIEGIERGMSAARFIWHADGGRTFPMFMTDMVDLLKNAPNLCKGTVHTWWMVQKRGQNYGVRLARPEELAEAGHTGGNAEDCPACKAYGLSKIPYPWLCLGPATED